MKQAPVESVVQLLQHCESFARQMLATSGEFYPFGAFVNLEGKVEAMGAHLGSEHSNSQELFRFLREALAQMEKEEKLLAYVIASNADIPKAYSPPFTDDIRVHVVAPEVCHRYVYTPYRLRSYRSFLSFWVSSRQSNMQTQSPVIFKLLPNHARTANQAVKGAPLRCAGLRMLRSLRR